MKNDSNDYLFYFPGDICAVIQLEEVLNKKMGGGECEDKQRQGGNMLVLENKEEVFYQLQGLPKVCPAGGKEQHLAEQALRQ